MKWYSSKIATLVLVTLFDVNSNSQKITEAAPTNEFERWDYSLLERTVESVIADDMKVLDPQDSSIEASRARADLLGYNMMVSKGSAVGASLRLATHCGLDTEDKSTGTENVKEHHRLLSLMLVRPSDLPLPQRITNTEHPILILSLLKTVKDISEAFVNAGLCKGSVTDVSKRLENASSSMKAALAQYKAVVEDTNNQS